MAKPMVVSKVPSDVPVANNAYDLPAVLMLAEIPAGEFIKLSAKVQRQMFGSVPFGKCEVLFDTEGAGKIIVSASCSFGTMGNTDEYTFIDAFARIDRGRTLRAGVSGPLDK